MSIGSTKTAAMQNIYSYKNDPNVVNKGVHVTNFAHIEGNGYVPLLSDLDYSERKIHKQKSTSACTTNGGPYNNFVDHGKRPMHRTTHHFNSSNANNANSPQNVFVTSTKLDYPRHPPRPREPDQHEDQFNHHFEYASIVPDHNSMDDGVGYINKHDRRAFSSYQADFYQKNQDANYQKSFDLMPKYSVGKKASQLSKRNEVTVYKNHATYSNGARESLQHDDEKQTNYWTQYKRTHDLLGAKKGGGESSSSNTNDQQRRHPQYPARTAYNIFSGERLQEPSWSANNDYKRKSGNVILQNARQNQHFIPN